MYWQLSVDASKHCCSASWSHLRFLYDATTAGPAPSSLLINGINLFTRRTLFRQWRRFIFSSSPHLTAQMEALVVVQLIRHVIRRSLRHDVHMTYWMNRYVMHDGYSLTSYYGRHRQLLPINGTARCIQLKKKITELILNI